MKLYDPTQLSDNINKCYQYYINNEMVNEILNLVNVKYSKDIIFNQLLEKQPDKSIEFQLLFSFTHFDDFHKCLIELEKTKNNPSLTIDQSLFDKIKLSLKT